MRHLERLASFQPLALRALIATAAAAIAFGGCASRTTSRPAGAEGEANSSSVTQQPSPTNPTSATLATVTSSPATTATGSHLPACASHDLTISLGHGGAGSGHIGAPILFTNHGQQACDLSGYPQATPVGGLTVTIKQTPHGYLGGLGPTATIPPHVDLAPGQSASAMVEGTDVPVPATAHCSTTIGRLAIRLPGQASDSGAATEIANPAGTCADIQIHPIVPGMTGRQQS